jgi:hypothetical protein
MTAQSAEHRIAHITLGALLSVRSDEELGAAREPTDDTDEIGVGSDDRVPVAVEDEAEDGGDSGSAQRSLPLMASSAIGRLF